MQASKHEPDIANESDVRRYWDSYYERRDAPTTPSQFAVFVFDEVASDASVLIDVGCGTGRDAVFFASNGVPTVGVDASENAIAFCLSRSLDPAWPLRFLQLSVDDQQAPDRLHTETSGVERAQGPLVIYARFFLHAVNRVSEARFLDWVSQLLTKRHGVLAVEFRTTRDSHQAKRTGDHYRRYVDPIGAISAAHERGLRLDYFVEGFGYARFKGEDAHVARCLFRK